MPLPSRHGLYEPTLEHDACGLGFVAHLRGEKSRSIVEQGLEHPRAPVTPRGVRRGSPDRRRRRHPPPAPAIAFFRKEGLRLGFEMPQSPLLRGGPGLPPAPIRPRAPRASACSTRWPSARASGSSAGVTSRWMPPGSAGSPAARCRCSGRSTSPGVASSPRPSSASCSSSASWRRTASAPRGWTPSAASTSRASAPRPSSTRVCCSRSSWPASTRTSRTEDVQSGLALVHSRFSHQHLPHLGAGPAVPLHRAQRRDQHRARQPELDERAPQPAAQSAKFGGSLDRLFPIIVARQERLGPVRQHARAARPRRPHAAARDDDDDPRGLGEARRDGRRTGAPSTSTPARSSSRGTARRRSPSPTAR